jgi:hypothetical protein
MSFSQLISKEYFMAIEPGIRAKYAAHFDKLDSNVVKLEEFGEDVIQMVNKQFRQGLLDLIRSDIHCCECLCCESAVPFLRENAAKEAKLCYDALNALYVDISLM